MSAELDARVERFVGAPAIARATERRFGAPMPPDALDRFTRTILGRILPHVAPPDGSLAKSDEVLVSDLCAAIVLCDCGPSEDFVTAVVRWFMADAGLEATA